MFLSPDESQGKGEKPVYLGLGSNLGDREANLRKAIRLLSRKLRIEGVSSIYETEPQDFFEQPKFLNAVCRAATNLGPAELLEETKIVEKEMGRVPTFRYGPRVIDIDILFYGDLVLETPTLTLPHPRMAERAFVLVPLAEVAGDVVHPVVRRKVSDLLASVAGKEGIKFYRPSPTVA